VKTKPLERRNPGAGAPGWIVWKRGLSNCVIRASVPSFNACVLTSTRMIMINSLIWSKNATVTTSAGIRLAAHPPRIVIPTSTAELLPFATAADDRSHRLMAQGRVEEAERFAHLAY